MTILIYDYRELEERPSKHLKVWKAWHIILYVLAAIFGVLNYTFLFQTEHLFDNHCVLYPRNISLYWVPKLPINASDIKNTNDNTTNEHDAQIDGTTALISEGNAVSMNETFAQKTTTPVPSTDENKKTRREATELTTTNEEVTVEQLNGTMIVENSTHRKVLDPLQTMFQKDSDSRCQFAEYMPLLSAVFAIVWTTLFIMCPKGGRTRTGLPEPWRILTPAFLFAFCMVILTGYSFSSTNGGLEAFCAAFQNYTNSTNCSSVNRFIELPDNSSWSIAGRISATRAASAGVWASWTCACALLLARCILGADFVVKHTAVHLVKDPQQKVTPFLRKHNSRRSQRSAQNSPTKRDAASVKSEPTATTELVTATVEHEGREIDSQPTSPAMTPTKDKQGDELEMTMRKMVADDKYSQQQP